MYDANQLTVVDPSPAADRFLTQHQIRHLKVAVTADNHQALLARLFPPRRSGPGFVVHLSVDTSSLDLMRWCRAHGALYIDTVFEPWAGFYFDTRDNAARTNYALCQAVRDEKARHSGGPTAGGPAAAPTPARRSGSSRKRCCGWPPTPAGPPLRRPTVNAGRG